MGDNRVGGAIVNTSANYASSNTTSQLNWETADGRRYHEALPGELATHVKVGGHIYPYGGWSNSCG